MTSALAAVSIPASAPWVPPSVRERWPAGAVRRIVFTEAERKILRRRRKRRPSAWCEDHRILTRSVYRGRWRNETTPYWAGVMDASFFPSVREITLCAAPQTGKSEAVANCIAVAIDQEPGPVIMCYPDQDTADINAEDLIGAMIKASPRLRSYLTGLADDVARKAIRLVHMPIYFAWARSASSLANKPCRYAVSDEADKYPETSGKRETSPILLVKARLTTYAGQEKHWILSTPTVKSGPVWRAYTAAQARFDYWAACPFCGEEQRMVFARITWAHKEEPDADGRCHSEDPERIEAEGLAWYECARCGQPWSDYERDLAVRRGGWRERETGTRLAAYLALRRPAKIAFHVPSWLSRFVSLAKVAASFLRGLADVTAFKDFYNKHLAEPWELTVTSKRDDQILAARGPELPAQTVPAEAVGLSAGVDVQMNGFWFAVRAWSRELTSWLVHYGFLATWGELERLLFETAFPVAETGRTMRIFRACVDTGGGKKYENMSMTEEKEFWLLQNRGRGGVSLWGTKGASSPLASGMLALGQEILTTPSGKRLPGGLRIITVDTAKAKDQYHFRLSLAAAPETRDLPGAAFLHRDTGGDYVAQILAEEKKIDERGREAWVNVHQRPNHLLDAEVLAAACVEMEFPGGGLRLLAAARTEPAAAVQAAAPPPELKKVPPLVQRIRDYERPGWMNR